MGATRGGGARVRPRGERRGHAEERSRPGYPRVGPEGRPGNDRCAEARVGEVVEVRGKTRDAPGTKAGARGDRPASGRVADREGGGGVNGTGAWEAPRGRRGVSGGVSGGPYPATTGGVPLADRGGPDVARRARCRFLRSTSPPGMPYRRRHRPPHVRATPPPDTTRASESPRARVPLREAPRNRLTHRFRIVFLIKLEQKHLGTSRRTPRTLLGVRPHRVSSRNPHRARSRRRVHFLHVKLQT